MYVCVGQRVALVIERKAHRQKLSLCCCFPGGKKGVQVLKRKKKIKKNNNNLLNFTDLNV